MYGGQLVTYQVPYETNSLFLDLLEPNPAWELVDNSLSADQLLWYAEDGVTPVFIMPLVSNIRLFSLLCQYNQYLSRKTNSNVWNHKQLEKENSHRKIKIAICITTWNK